MGAGVGPAGASSAGVVCLVFCCSFFSASSLSRCWRRYAALCCSCSCCDTDNSWREADRGACACKLDTVVVISVEVTQSWTLNYSLCMAWRNPPPCVPPPATSQLQCGCCCAAAYFEDYCHVRVPRASLELSLLEGLQAPHHHSLNK